MKIALIWPYGAFDGSTMPLCYLYLIPILKKEHDVQFLDCALYNIHPKSKEFKKFIQDFKPDVVGVSAWTVHKEMATLTLESVKKINQKIITIAGGPHFTGSATYSLHSDSESIDFVLKGEAELTLMQFLKTISNENFSEEELSKIEGLCFIKKDGLLHESLMKFPPSLDDFGLPDYSIINLKGYFKKGYSYRSDIKMQAPILTTRGCPYTCDFCAAPYLNGRGIRKHSVPYMKEVIENLYQNFGIRHFNIIDDNFTFDTTFAKTFSKMIIDNKNKFKGISFGTPNGIRIERSDEQLFYLMKAAGWKRLIVAPESGSQKMVDLMAKHLNLKIVPQKIKQIQKAGLEVEGFFIIGHPGENNETVAETKEFIKNVKFDHISPHIFQPLQGTPIFDQLLELGKITKDQNITSYQDVNWLPDNWTKEELLKVISELMNISVVIFPLRFEWIFSRHIITGKIIERIFGKKIRHILFQNTYKIRKKISDSVFYIKNKNELKNQIQKQIEIEDNEENERKRLNKLKEYEQRIMKSSDELKKKSMEEQKRNIIENEVKLEMVLDDCEKISTHKNRFSD